MRVGDDVEVAGCADVSVSGYRDASDHDEVDTATPERVHQRPQVEVAHLRFGSVLIAESCLQSW